MTEILGGSANGMFEMSICGGMRRLVPSDVRSVRLRSARLAAHPHLKHFLHAIVHPRRVVAALSLLTPRHKERATHMSYVLLRAKRASVGRARMGLMDFEARGSQVPQTVLDVRRTTRKRVPADDEATKKGTNPNPGTDVDHL